MNLVISDRCDGFPENGQREDSCQVLHPGHQGRDQVVTFIQKKIMTPGVINKENY